MKKCKICEIVKDEKEFGQRYCKDCTKEYYREYYQKNKEIVNATHNKWRKKFYQWWYDYKSQLKCENCGFNHPATLDFHHIRDKKDDVGRLVTMLNKKKLLEEVAKCIVLCSNCHRIHHASKNIYGESDNYYKIINKQT